MNEFAGGPDGARRLRDLDIAMVSAGRAQGWAIAHANGDAPDRMPYGLDRLADEGFRPSLLAPGEAGRLRRAVGKAAGGVWLPAGRRRRPGTALLAWDERAAVPYLMAGRHERVTTGCIWATESGAPRRTRLLARAALGRAHHVFVLSPAQLPVLREWGIRSERCSVAHFGVDAEFWTRRSAVEPGEETMVISIGNDRRRDWATLGQAWALLRSQRATATLTVAANINRPGLPDARVVSLSHRRLRDDLYHRATVAVVLTTFNLHGSGMTSVLEAMSTGCPVVTTDHPGIRPYVQHMETGWLVPPGDARAVAIAVKTLKDDPRLAQEMGSAAAERVRSEFTTAHLAARLAPIISAEGER